MLAAVVSVTGRGVPRWARWLVWPESHEQLLALALIVLTVAAGWLLGTR